MLSEFTEDHMGWPARIFDSVAEAQIFMAMLARMEISHRVILDTPPKRLRLPMQTVVILLDGLDGIRH
jgi:hypothetical protein